MSFHFADWASGLYSKAPITAYRHGFGTRNYGYWVIVVDMCMTAKFGGMYMDETFYYRAVVNDFGDLVVVS